MATDYCKYHPLAPAIWHCTTCHISLCDDCSAPSSENDAPPLCLLCNQSLTNLQQQAPTLPFWLQSTHFLRLPLSLWGMMLCLILFVMPLIVPQHLALAVEFLAYVFAGLYGWTLLQQAATGQLQDISLAVFVKLVNKIAVQVAFVIAIIFVGIDLLAIKFGWGMLANLLSLLLVLVFPALLMATAVEKSLVAAMQIGTIQGILAQLRFFYLPVMAMAVLLLLIVSAITGLLADVLSASMTQGLKQALYSYGLWVMMSIVGYVLFQFQQLLNFDVNTKKTKKRTTAKNNDKQQARLEVYLKEGAYEKAAALLKTQAEKNKHNPDIQERYYQLLIFMQDEELVPYQACHFMEALLEVGKERQALEVLTKVKRLVPDFKPQNPEMSFNLAKACAEAQNYDLASELLCDLHKEFPHYPQLAEAYLLRAKLLHEKLNATTEALATMEYLVGRFQKHPRYALIEDFWRSLGGKPKQDFIL
jgi:tetratricopeptide (TPR) repeat protein